MPSIKCRACGGVTNTAVSDHLFKFEDNEAEMCFAKFVDGVWVKGCGYDGASVYERILADAVIKGT